MTLQKLLLTAPFLLAPAMLMAQGSGVTPADLLKPLKDSWPTYNGDYSGKRYSALTQVNQIDRQEPDAGLDDPRDSGRRQRRSGGGRGGRGGEAAATSSSAAKARAISPLGGGTIKASVLQVDGTLYFTMPDNAWAVDARDGRELWHYFWKTKGGTHIGNRGLGMWNNYLYMETPDDYLVSLDAKTGKERWHKTIADLDAGLLLDARADRRRQSRAGRHRQRYRFARLPAVVRSRNRRPAMEALHRADEEGRSRPRYLGQPGCGAARRRADLDSGRLRSRDQALHLRHRQSDAGLHHGHARRGRQPVHLRAGRGERGHRQDGLVFPDLAARHARLRFRADAGSGGRHVQRQDAEAGADGGAQRLLLHPRPRDRRAPGDQQVRAADQLGEGPEQVRRPAARSRQRTRRWPARWFRRPPDGTINWEPPAYSPRHRPVLRRRRATRIRSSI